MRTFIAIALTREIRDYLASIQEELKKCRADVKWVQPENIHLTLKFLGERDEKKIEKIKLELEETARDKKSFSIRLSAVGAFPKLDFPRIIWVGIDRGEKETEEIAYELEERIAKIGIPKEDRPFSSHITIARLKSPLNRESLVQELKKLAPPQGKEFKVGKITLYKSTLTPQGPIYEALKEANLKTT
jgi:2'-5' RNA ligase